MGRPVNVAKTLASAFAELQPGTRRRSWTSPRSSLCSRGNIAGFRRRRYEMAETARVTEAQRLGYVEATHLFRHGFGLLVWQETGLCPEEKGLRRRFLCRARKNKKTLKRPGWGSTRQLRVDTVGINWREVSATHTHISFLFNVFDLFVFTVREWEQREEAQTYVAFSRYC